MMSRRNVAVVAEGRRRWIMERSSVGVAVELPHASLKVVSGKGRPEAVVPEDSASSKTKTPEV